MAGVQASSSPVRKPVEIIIGKYADNVMIIIRVESSLRLHLALPTGLQQRLSHAQSHQEQTLEMAGQALWCFNLVQATSKKATAWQAVSMNMHRQLPG